ncbi:Ycf66 family protein [Microcoleus sp. herbarium7]|uniref:Ycf66 family protein n=1 Tax=Microcoleus sp. herbarium7 TaxID=3055435 RepID=UPI002FD1D03F
MLAYILALAVGLGSFSIYMAAFFFPEVHRKSDFTWSGVGLFYALILWACAGRITGALLLGQMAGVAMLGFFAWETLTLRRQVTPIAQQTPVPGPAALAAAGVPFAGLFGKKKEPAAAKKPKFVRSPKPKADAVPAPAVNEGEVKVEQQPPIPSPIPQTLAESSLAPDSTNPDSSAPAISEIPVFSVETPAAETKPAPAESASSFTPLPLELSEIAAPATAEPAEAQPEVKQQPEDDDFDQMWRAMAKDSQSAASSIAPAAPTAAPEANSTPAKTAKKSAGFGSLFGNLKNSLGGMLGLAAAKNKSDAVPQTPTPKAATEPIAPESKITAIPAPEIDRILESELAEAAAEATAETSTAAAETNQGMPFPTDVEAMAELMAAETASSGKIEDSLETETPPAAPGEPEAAAGVPESPPAVSLEMTVVEVAEPVEIQVPGEPGLSVQVETVSVSVISIESTADPKPSSEEEQPELIRPNPPTSELVEAAQPAAESKSENISDEDKPST